MCDPYEYESLLQSSIIAAKYTVPHSLHLLDSYLIVTEITHR